MKETLDTVLSGLSIVVVALSLVGLAARFILLPWLRQHIVAPMRQVEKQVSENAHANSSPTVLDRIDDVQQEVHAMRADFKSHLDWSERWVDLVEREIRVLRMERDAKRDQGDPS